MNRIFLILLGEEKAVGGLVTQANSQSVWWARGGRQMQVKKGQAKERNGKYRA